MSYSGGDQYQNYNGYSNYNNGGYNQGYGSYDQSQSNSYSGQRQVDNTGAYYGAPPSGPPPGSYNNGYNDFSSNNGYQSRDSNNYGGGYNNQGYNNQGYNNQGYNNQGYNNQGYNNQGYNNQGYNNQGYNNQGGYDQGGYNNQGYDNNNGNYNNNSYSNGNYNNNYNNGYNDWNAGNQSNFNYDYGSYNKGGGYNPHGGYNSQGNWYGYQEGGYDDPSYGGSHETQNMSFMPPPSQSQSWGVSGYTDYQYSQCTGNRKALLIGVNYIGQKAALKGCINDVQNIKQYLIEKQGYKPENMVILTDDLRDPRSIPTKANILRGCQWLVKDAQPNDSLFFHFSGHGGQTEDLDGDEEDGFDDVIYPVDYTQAGFIVDDQLHDIMVRPLLPGVRLTALMDCCHSGTGLDLPYVYSTKGVLKEPNLLKDTGKSAFQAFKSYASGDINGVIASVSSGIDRFVRGNKNTDAIKKRKMSPADVVMLSGCKDDQTSADSFENGAATGAMSHAFIQVMRNNPNQSYLSLLNNTRDILASKYQQKPQLSCSHPLDCNLKFIM